MARLWTRAIRPPSDEIPNANAPGSVPPATVGPPEARPGDPHGVTVAATEPPYSPPPPTVRASAWSGWPAEWWVPNWGGRANGLAGIAWTCIDKNASALAMMPPYLVGAAPTVDAGWLRNPDPDIYTSWNEFAKQLFWDYQGCGEAFVLATARYSTGWPARFHVVAPWYVNVEMDYGRRRYTIGNVDVSADVWHVRYQSTVDDAHGHGPLEAGGAFVTAAAVLARYGAGLAVAGGIPASVLTHPEELSAEQALELRTQWITARQSSLGEPAVLSGGVKWEPTQMNPKDMALLELMQHNESRIAVMLGVPPFLVGLPSGGDSMTYSNVNALFDYHWRDGLKPMAAAVTTGLSDWLLPRGTMIEVNEDAYVRPAPLERAQTYEILNRIQDADGNPVLTVQQIQQAERLTNATPQEGAIR